MAILVKESLFIKAEAIKFYPNVCLGGWQNIKNAEGKPDLAEDASAEEFSDKNSAVLGNTVSQIFCSDFVGEIPKDAQMKTLLLKLSWSPELGVSFPNDDATTTVIVRPSDDVSTSIQNILDAPASSTLIISSENATTTADEESGTTTVDERLEIGDRKPEIDDTPAVVETPIAIPTDTAAPVSFFRSLFQSVFAEEITSETNNTQHVADSMNSEAEFPSESEATTVIVRPSDDVSTSIQNILDAPASSTLIISSENATTTADEESGTTTVDERLEIGDRKPATPPISSDDPSDFLEVLYTLDGTEWRSLGKVNKDEWTHEFKILVTEWSDISKLQVSIQSLPSADKLPKVYLDGMWLEAEYQMIKSQAIDDSPKEPQRKVVRSERVFKIIQNDFSADAEPSFEMHFAVQPDVEELKITNQESGTTTLNEELRITNQESGTTTARSRFKNLIKTAMAQGALVPQPFQVLEIKLLDWNGRKMSIEPITEEVNGIRRVKVPRPERQFTPGKYILHAEVLEGDTIYITEQEFTWGVLVINVNKSVYRSGEMAYIQMASLNSNGHTLCHEPLVLSITDPAGNAKTFSTENASISFGEECGVDNVTDAPDYFLHYTTSSTGAYLLSLTDQKTNHTITSKFYVRAGDPFEIERIGATRINPWKSSSYKMNLLVKANQDFSGSITESVPSGFEITPSEDKFPARVTSDQSPVTSITWDVKKVKSGDTFTLSYVYQAPKISPEIHLLGPLQFTSGNFLTQLFNNQKTDFKEERQWQIASDAVNVKIRQEINILDEYLPAASASYATSSSIIQINTTQYTSPTYYFEVVASSSASVAFVVELARTTGATTSTVFISSASSTSYGRFRSAAFTPTAGANEYVVRVGNASGATKGVIAARVVVLQDAAALSNTETQIEIGSATTTASNTTTLPLKSPKYWYYDSTKWDASPTFYAEVTYKTNPVASSTIYNVSATTTDTFFNYDPTAGTGYAVVEAWGPGGGGNGVSSLNSIGGGGGGGGAYVRSTTTAAIGSTYKIGVGRGGAEGTTVTSSSTLALGTTIIAQAAGGTGANGNTGGAGGTTANSTGGVKTAGGSGGNGENTGDTGGAGGGSAGPDGTGATPANAGNGVPVAGGQGDNGLGGLGGAAGTGVDDTCDTENGGPGVNNVLGAGGGGGGDGDTSSTCLGGNGGRPGGGGGGSDEGANTSHLGGPGQVKITEWIGTVGVALEESDGTGDGFQGWAFKTQIVGRGLTSTTSERIRSVSFTPTSGRNYRLVASTTNSTAPYYIYNAKIIVNQSNPGKLEPQYLLANTLFAAGTALQNFDTLLDPAEWSTNSTTYIHEANSLSGGLSDVKLQSGTETGGTPVDIAGTAITDVKQRTASSAFTFPASATTTDVIATANNGDLYASRILAQVDIGGILTQRDYIFLNDDGGDVNSYTQAHSAATSTPISGTPGVKRGERLIARIQIDNTGLGTSTAQYRLQWASSTDDISYGNWYDTSTTTEIRWSLSEKGALWGRHDGVPLKSRQVTASCNAGAPTYQEGRFVAGTATSTTFGIGPAQCTEIAYTFETSSSTLGAYYRLRVINGGTNTAFTGTYTYPKLQIESARTLAYSKEVRGASATSTQNAVASGNSSLAIGTDGFPVISYNNSTNNRVEVAKCTNTACTGAPTITAQNALGSISTSIAIGTDGFPVISYVDVSNFLTIAKCLNTACTGAPTITAQNAVISDSHSIAIGADGFPVISYVNTATGNLEVAKCLNAACTGAPTITAQNAVITSSPSIAIGTDGFPIISYNNGTNNRLDVAKCTNVACTGAPTITAQNAVITSSPSITIGTDGFPVISYNNDTNNRLDVAKCTNAACTGAPTITAQNAGSISASSIAIGTDGFPIISYRNTGTGKLEVAKCLNAACTGTPTITAQNAVASSFIYYTSLAIGVDGFPIISYTGGASSNFLNVAKCNNTSCVGTTSPLAYLPANATSLDTFLDDAGYNNVATSNDQYDSLSAASSSRLAYNFKKATSSNTDQISVTWEGQISVSTTTSLQIYNNSSGLWETLQSSTTPTGGADFTLTGTQSTSLSSYYDDSNIVATRLVTGTTTQATTLKTDQIMITFVAPQSVTFSLSKNAASFGTLLSSAARYASSTAAGDASDTSDAHTISVATNAVGGYVVTVNGPTLTSGANTIATSSTAVPSAPTTEQFGLRLIVNSGTGSATSPYNSAGWAFDSLNFPGQIASGSGDSVTTVFGVRYIGNIRSDTEAGNYITMLTYVATATF